MIPAHDPAAIARCAQALRQGRITSDYTPGHVADLLDALVQMIVDQRAHIDELERTFVTPATQAALRTEYARGFRDAQQQLVSYCPGEEALIMSIGPSFITASDMDRYAG
jgi:hypothetical protein